MKKLREKKLLLRFLDIGLLIFLCCSGFDSVIFGNALLNEQNQGEWVINPSSNPHQNIDKKLFNQNSQDSQDGFQEQIESEPQAQGVIEENKSTYPFNNTVILMNNATVHPEMVEDYGFYIDIERNVSIFAQFPYMNFTMFNISDTNHTQYLNNTYEYFIQNSTHFQNWTDFEPFDIENHSICINDLEKMWNNTEEATPISFLIRYDENVSYYLIELYRDNTSPDFDIGFSIDVNGELEPWSASIMYKFRDTPIVYLNISDNIEQNVSAHYIVNNQNHTANAIAYVGGCDGHLSPLSEIHLKSWDQYPEGYNFITFYITDTAGNPSSFNVIHFQKDTTPPSFESLYADQFWLKLNETDLTDYPLSAQGVYQVNGTINFTMSFKESSIPSVEFVIQYLDLSQISDSVAITYLIDPKSQFFINTWKSNATKESNYQWELAISNDQWAIFKDRLILVSVTALDNLGNPGHFTFFMKYTTDINLNPDQGSWKLKLIGGVILISVAMIISGIFLFVRKKRRTPSFEEKLKELDGDLLDVVLQPIDSVKSQKFYEYTKRLHNRVDMEAVTPPDLKEFLKTPLQTVDLDMIKDLLTKYKMDPYEQEEFIREMLAMPSDERISFIKQYMENQSENDPEDDQFYDDL
ncbi:MAG: hypothetical protein ACTSXK_03865 [Promethearchaeota archaeon]